MTYHQWIREKYPTPQSAKLQCDEATRAMIEEFPELLRVRGHVMVGVDRRGHWWCVDSGGQVVDPTAHQWASPIVFYDAFEEGDEEPHGKCLHCGDLLFRSHGADAYLCGTCNKNRTLEDIIS